MKHNTSQKNKLFSGITNSHPELKVNNVIIIAVLALISIGIFSSCQKTDLETADKSSFQLKEPTIINGILKFEDESHFSDFVSFASQQGYSNNDKLIDDNSFISATFRIDQIMGDGESIYQTEDEYLNALGDLAAIETDQYGNIQITPTIPSRTMGMLFNQDRKLIIGDNIYSHARSHVYKTRFIEGSLLTTQDIEVPENVFSNVNIIYQNNDPLEGIDSRAINMCFSGSVNCEHINTSGRDTKLFGNVKLIVYENPNFPQIITGSIFEATSAHERKKSFGCCWTRTSVDELKVGIKGDIRFYDTDWNQVCNSFYYYGDSNGYFNFQMFSCTSCHTAHRTLVNTNPFGNGENPGLLDINCGISQGAYLLCIQDHQSYHWAAPYDGKPALTCLIGN